MADAPIATLESIQKRVLWLSALMVHHANSTRPNPDGTKVGGHQASSSSVVSLMTALYFDALRPGDIVAVKAHGSPIFYAIEYLRGRLAAERAPGAAQPSAGSRPTRAGGRTRRSSISPRAPWASGAVTAGLRRPRRALSAPITAAPRARGASSRWSATQSSTRAMCGRRSSRSSLAELGNLLWIVDMNRQSLDRVVPDARRGQLARRGSRARGLARHRAALGPAAARAVRAGPAASVSARGSRAWPTPSTTRCCALPAGAVRKALVAARDGEPDAALDRLLADVPGRDAARPAGRRGRPRPGRDPRRLRRRRREPRRGPCVILADTIKGWGYRSRATR